MAHHERRIRSTLQALELDHGDSVELVLADGRTTRIELVSTKACIHSSTLERTTPLQGHPGAHSVLRMHANLRIDGDHVEVVRWIGNQRSFAEPYVIGDLWLWFDVCADLFRFLNDNHGGCAPRHDAVFAVHDARCRICPTLLHPWCPLPADGLRIERDCYDGQDCWLGPYFGADAHGGLDINHPAGTTLWTPLAIDRHAWFAHRDRGDNNNRWRGFHDWEDGSTWQLQSHHLIRLLRPLDAPIPAGFPYAISAGVLTGSHEHSHFKWAIIEPGSDQPVWLDPWLLFRQMYRDRAEAVAQAPA